MEAQGEVERIMEILPDCTEDEIYEALAECEMDSDKAITRLLSSRGEEETRAGVPKQWKKRVEHISEIVKEMQPKFTEEEIYEMLRQCNMDPDLAAQRLLSLEGFEEVKSKLTKKKERINAQESKSQHEVGSSSSSILKQGGSRDDDAGRKETTHDNTAQGIQEADSSARSHLDNVSSPLAAAVSSQLDHLDIGEGKGKEVVRSTDDNTAVLSRSHFPPLLAVRPPRIHASRARSNHRASRNNVSSSSRNDSGKFPSAAGSSSTTAVISRSRVPPLHAVGPPRIHASRARSDPRASRNNVASSSRNDSGKFPSAVGSSLTTCNGEGTEFNGERLIRGLPTCATLRMPSMPEEQEIPQTHSCEAPAGAYNPNSVSNVTLECEQFLPSTSELFGPPQMPLLDFPAQLVDRLSEDHPFESPSRYTPSVPLRSGAIGPQFKLPEISLSEILEMSDADLINLLRSMERPAIMSVNAPPFTPSASIHQSSQSLLHGNSLSPDHGFTHPHIEPSSSQPQLPLQYGYVNHDGYMHQNFGYDMTSPQQEVYRGSTSSQANADPSSWGSFPGTGSTPDQFLLNSPDPFDISWTRQSSTLHVQAQNQHRNDYRTIGTNYNFPARNNQTDPGVISTLPAQQQGGLPGRLPLPSDGNNQHGDLPSASQEVYQGHVNRDGYVHQNFGYDMTSPQQEVYQGGSSFQANADPSSWGSFPGTGSTLDQFLLNSPAPFDISWTGQNSTLHIQAQNQHRNDYRPIGTNYNFTARINQPDPGVMSTLPEQQQGGLPGWLPLPSDGDNQHGDMPLALQELCQGYVNHDGCMHRNFGYDMTSPQQEVYRGGGSSWTNADPSSWGFAGTGSTPDRFLLNSPAPSDITRTGQNSTLHFHAQNEHRNDYCPIGTNYSFAARNNQLDPGVMSILPEQQGGLLGWLPLPSDGNNQHGDMPSAQDEVYQGGSSSRATGNASGWESFLGTRNSSYKSPPNPPYSPASFNISWTSSDSTLHAQDQYRNDYNPLEIPGPATTPRGSFPRWPLLPANANNWSSGEGPSQQYDNQGQRPGMRARPNHQQQSLYNSTTGNLQDPSSIQPPRDPGP